MIAKPGPGTLTGNGIRFELDYPHPPAAVWRAITDPESLATWFMPLTFDLRVGGAVTLKYSSRDVVPAEGTITELVPEQVLEYHFEKGPWEWPESTLRFELTPVGDSSTRLVFTQTIAPDTVWTTHPEAQIGGPGTLPPGTCAGWQGFFQEGLTRFLDGRAAPIYDDTDDVLMSQREELYRRLYPDAG